MQEGLISSRGSSFFCASWAWRGEGASEAGLPVVFLGFGSAQERRWRLALELPGWVDCSLHAGGGPVARPQPPTAPTPRADLEIGGEKQVLPTPVLEGPRPPTLLSQPAGRQLYLCASDPKGSLQAALLFNSLSSITFVRRIPGILNDLLGLEHLIWGVDANLVCCFFQLWIFLSSFLKMNDFGIKNMDQVAPVASSYRGTLKVSEHVLIET